MFRELKNTHSYPKVIAFLSIFSFVSALAYSFIGELFLPFAVAFYSALLLFENPTKRIFSLIIPIATVTLCVILTDIYSLITLEYVILSAVLVLSYTRLSAKGECSVYMTVITSLFVILSLYLGAARAVGSFNYEDVIQYYSDIYSTFKEGMVEILSTYTVPSRNGTNEYFMTQGEASDYIDYISKFAVSLVGIFSFVLSGIALKIFTRVVLHYSEKGITRRFASFIPSSLVAYLYVICAIIEAFSGMQTVLSIAIANVYTILMIPFAYVGFKYLSLMCKINDRRFLGLFLYFAVIFMFQFAVPILSYFGVFVTVSTNKNLNDTDFRIK